MLCKIRDQAQGPRYSSQPHRQLTPSTPELRAQLNSPTTKKEESPYLQACPNACPDHVTLSQVVELRTLLGNVEKEGCHG